MEYKEIQYNAKAEYSNIISSQENEGYYTIQNYYNNGVLTNSTRDGFIDISGQAQSMYDLHLKINTDNITTLWQLSDEYNYWIISMTLNNTTSVDREIIIKLCINSNSKSIASYWIPANSKQNIKFIVNMDNNYTDIQFELQRLENENYAGPIGIDTSTIELEYLNNIFNLKDVKSLITGYVEQIGIQGYENMIFCLNGEMIKIGESKHYEPLSNTLVNFIGFSSESLNNAKIFNEESEDDIYWIIHCGEETE